MAKSLYHGMLKWGGLVLMYVGSAAICGLSERAMKEARYPVVSLAIAAFSFFSGLAIFIRAVKRDRSAED
jgi:hypothetical protein